MENHNFKSAIILVILLMVTSFTNAQWTQIGSDIDGEFGGDFSGSSVSLSSNGNIMAVGAEYNSANGYHSGHARVFQVVAGVWTQLGGDIDGQEPEDNAGHSVDLNSTGNILAVGVLKGDCAEVDAGYVKVFEYSIGDWIQLGDSIPGEREGDLSGKSVSLSADGYTVAIGEPYNSNFQSRSGRVAIYEYSAGVWTQKGDYIYGEAIYDNSGWSVSLSFDGNIVAIGAKNNADNGSQSGHTRIYNFATDETWKQMGQDIDGAAQSDQSGESVSLSSDGNIVAIGARYHDGPFSSTRSGHVRVFQFSLGLWVQLGEDINGESPLDKSGSSVSLSSDGTVVAIGAQSNGGINGSNSGHVRIYHYSDTVWTQKGGDLDGEEAGDWSGKSVCLSQNGDTVAIGAWFNCGNGAQSGHVRVYNIPPVVSISETPEKGISIFPNPTKGKITIMGENIRKVEIWNINGQIVKELSIVEEQFEIDLSNQPKGIYIIKATTDKVAIVNKIVLE